MHEASRVQIAINLAPSLPMLHVPLHGNLCLALQLVRWKSLQVAVSSERLTCNDVSEDYFRTVSEMSTEGKLTYIKVQLITNFSDLDKI